MTYRVIIPKAVQKQLNNFSQKIRSRLLTEIRLLKINPRPHGVKKLKGYKNTYRIRVGNYRIIYEIEDREMIILVLSSVHRRDAY